MPSADEIPFQHTGLFTREKKGAPTNRGGGFFLKKLFGEDAKQEKRHLPKDGQHSRLQSGGVVHRIPQRNQPHT